MEDHVFQAALAGLLHDVGKIAQRAGENGTRQWDAQAQADFGFKHALLTSDFIESALPQVWKAVIKNATSSHHRPQTRLDNALALADRLSSGERDANDDGKATQPKQLLSIFCDVSADGLKAPQKAYLPLAPLELKRETIFPDAAWDDKHVDQAYQRLWSELGTAAQALKKAFEGGENRELFLENWLLILQRFAWSVPSAYYKSSPNISLFDHSRMTAALASVLIDSTLTDGDLAGLAAKPGKVTDQPLALLIGGDLSGVQAFIYTITARGATSALRGRSFYIQLLTEALARAVLRRLDLPYTNLIYAGGANFYILARPSDAARLGEIQKAISQALFYHHRGDLFLALASQPLGSGDFTGGRLSWRWEELGRGLEKAKQQRFVELGADLVYVFAAQGHGGNEDEHCQVCGVEHPDTQADERSTSADNEGKVRKCPNCFGFEELGDQLRRAAFLALEHTVISESPSLREMGKPGDWRDMLACLGMKPHVLAEDELAGWRITAPTTLWAVEDSAQAALAPRLTGNTAIGRRLLVNVSPVLRTEDKERQERNGEKDLPAVGRIVPFDVLEGRSSGIGRLGVLRMDVDNLGKLFAEGLGDLATLSRVASLSFAVSLYFDGWVKMLAEDRNQRDRAAGMGDRLYSIYSGGDDLFFVGAWDAVVELARQVRIDLGIYAANHPGIDASAGIVLVGGKYPLSQAAEDAARAEEHAKGYSRWQAGKEQKKDAVCFLGQTIDWARFGLEPCEQMGLQSAHGLMHMLLGHKGSTQRPVIRRLIGLFERYQEAQQLRADRGEDVGRSGQAQVLWGPWNWLANYSLYRLYDQNKKETYIEELRQALKDDQFRSIEWVGLAARWAELMLR